MPLQDCAAFQLLAREIVVQTNNLNQLCLVPAYKIFNYKNKESKKRRVRKATLFRPPTESLTSLSWSLASGDLCCVDFPYP
jgi:hypothetical protein